MASAWPIILDSDLLVHVGTHAARLLVLPFKRS